MGTKVVGILSPGDMGSATGRTLCDRGMELTHQRAKEAGLRVVSSYEELVIEADLLLSILVPSEAVVLADHVADRLVATGSSLVYADFNAGAPETAQHINAVIGRAGSRFVDGGIIGGPPRPGGQTHFYCSGPDVGIVMELGEFGLDLRYVGEQVGQASGLKMVYAASTKGTTALWTELLVAAHAMGLADALEQELVGSPIYGMIKGSIQTMPRRSRRWIGEMEEIAKTFESLGLTPSMFTGAAEMYRLVGKTPLGDQTSRQTDPSYEETIRVIADANAQPRQGSA